MQFESSEQLCEHISTQTGSRAILSFSTGKDSVVAWLQMRRYFKKIVPFYMYCFQDLSFLEKSLAYYEDFFQTRIIRLPHPSLYRWINGLMFQAPENCHIIEDIGLADFDFTDLERFIREDCGLEGVYMATGVRAVDSLNRWASIKKYGPINENRMIFLPIYDYRKERMVRELRESGVKLPYDYRLFGRSFDGVDYRFLKPLKDNLPEDYQKVLDYFPLAELEIKRMEYRERYYKELENGKQ